MQVQSFWEAQSRHSKHRLLTACTGEGTSEIYAPTMNVSNSLRPLSSLTAQLSRLSVGISRTASRSASTIDLPLETKASTPATKKPKKKKQKKYVEPDFQPGHGEKIWIFNNFVSGLTVYSHSPVLKVRSCKPSICSSQMIDKNRHSYRQTEPCAKSPSTERSSSPPS